MGYNYLYAHNFWIMFIPHSKMCVEFKPIQSTTKSHANEQRNFQVAISKGNEKIFQPQAVRYGGKVSFRDDEMAMLL